jgi:hypothetical protein
VKSGVQTLLRLLALPFGAACGESSTEVPGPPPEPLLTEADRARLVMVRPCRSSVEHPFTHVVVKVEPTLVERYDKGPFPFPAGALVVKDEFSDAGCRTPSGATLMRKEPAGYHPSFGDWRWQRLDPAGRVLEDGKVAGCASCHAGPACRARDFVCSEP